MSGNQHLAKVLSCTQTYCISCYCNIPVSSMVQLINVFLFNLFFSMLFVHHTLTLYSLSMKGITVCFVRCKILYVTVNIYVSIQERGLSKTHNHGSIKKPTRIEEKQREVVFVFPIFKSMVGICKLTINGTLIKKKSNFPHK